MNSGIDMLNPNKLALDRMVKGEPVLVDISLAGEVIPGLVDGLILHAGPPIAWRDMCGPMRAAVVGAIQYEGWAGDTSIYEQEKMVAPGCLYTAIKEYKGKTEPVR